MILRSGTLLGISINLSHSVAVTLRLLPLGHLILLSCLVPLIRSLGITRRVRAQATDQSIRVHDVTEHRIK